MTTSTIQTSTVTKIDSADRYQNPIISNEKLIALQNGTLIVVTFDYNTGVFNFYKSLNKGVTWALLTTITSAYPVGTSFEIIAVGNNIGFFVGSTSISYKLLNGTTGAIAIETNEIASMNEYANASFAVVRDNVTGTIHLVWVNEAIGNLFYIKTTNDGVAWSTQEKLTHEMQGSYGVRAPNIVIKNSEAHVFYAINTYVYTLKKTDNIIKRVMGLSYGIVTMDATVTKDGVFHLVAAHNSNMIGYATSSDAEQWSTTSQMATGSKPTIQTSLDGTVHVNFMYNNRRYYAKKLITATNFTVSSALNEMTEIASLKAIDLEIIQPVYIYRNATGIVFDGEYNLETNAVPTITITSPTANVTLHENSSVTLAGNATDLDADDVVTIKYQVDSGAVRNLHSAVSDGATPIDFSKSLTYKEGVLKDGATTVTSTLDKDVPHTVSMWAEDGNGGKSTIVTRTFFVVPNRPPSITVNPIAAQSDLINSNVINISGAVTDLDHNDVTVTFKINDGEEQQIYQGPPSAFTFNILLNDLKVGANTVIVKGTDIYNTAGTKTLTINKTHNATAVNTAVARYQIQAPTGSAKSILLWVTRTLGNLGITAEVSLTNGTEAEDYVALNETNSAVVNGAREEEYAYQGTMDKEKIILKITYNRTDAAVIDTIKQISGVLF